MEAMNIRGMGYVKENNRSHYLIVKENLIMEPINKIMEKIQCDPLFYESNDVEKPMNTIDHAKNNNYDVDFVFTENRLIIIVRADEKHQTRFKELILAYGIFKD